MVLRIFILDTIINISTYLVMTATESTIIYLNARIEALQNKIKELENETLHNTKQ